MRRLVPLVFVASLLALASPAGAFSVGLQDQGAYFPVLARVAGELGVTTLRVVAKTDDPMTQLVADYHAAGFQVQGVIVVKRWTHVRDIRAVMQAWAGQVVTVSVGNEPELNGLSACRYARLFASSRRMIRREFPGVKVGFGEFSPAKAFEYIQQIAKCHVRIRADFTAVHPYQFFSDPLGSPSERSGVGTWLGLGNLGPFRRHLARSGLPTRLRATEFSYLVSGPYKIPMGRAAAYWPRAIRQARRWCRQLIIYGLGPVYGASTWGSASLLDRFGRSTPALQAIARALGRTLPPDPPLAPVGDFVSQLPSGDDNRGPLPLVTAPVMTTPVVPPAQDQPAEGASPQDGGATSPPDEPPAGAPFPATTLDPAPPTSSAQQASTGSVTCDPGSAGSCGGQPGAP